MTDVVANGNGKEEHPHALAVKKRDRRNHYRTVDAILRRNADNGVKRMNI